MKIGQKLAALAILAAGVVFSIIYVDTRPVHNPQQVVVTRWNDKTETWNNAYVHQRPDGVLRVYDPDGQWEIFYSEYSWKFMTAVDYVPVKPEE